MKTFVEICLEHDLEIPDEVASDMELAAGLFADQFKKVSELADRSNATMVRFIVNFICEYYGFSLPELINYDKRPGTSEVRAMIYWFLRSETDLTLVQIGALLGRKYTTVLNSNKNMANDLKENKSLRRRFVQLSHAMLPCERAVEVVKVVNW